MDNFVLRWQSKQLVHIEAFEWDLWRHTRKLIVPVESTQLLTISLVFFVLIRRTSTFLLNAAITDLFPRLQLLRIIAPNLLETWQWSDVLGWNFGKRILFHWIDARTKLVLALMALLRPAVKRLVRVIIDRADASYFAAWPLIFDPLDISVVTQIQVL